jgi:methionyl-tRNA formyltransferase
VAQVRAAAPDFLFSFYYRMLLGAPLLAMQKRGALNMHGSLLPRYRGRGARQLGRASTASARRARPFIT